MMTSLKNIIKEAILEALVEFSNGVAVYTSETPETDKDPNKESDKESGKGGISGETSGGGVGPGGKPKPDAGVGVFGLR